MNEIYSRLLAHEVPHIQVTVDPDEFQYIEFNDHVFGWFYEDDVKRLFCDPSALVLTLRIHKWFDDFDPYNGCDDNEVIPVIFNSIIANDVDWIAEQIQDAKEELLDDPFIFCDLIDEADRLITILQAE